MIPPADGEVGVIGRDIVVGGISRSLIRIPFATVPVVLVVPIVVLIGVIPWSLLSHDEVLIEIRRAESKHLRIVITRLALETKHKGKSRLLV